MHIIAGRLKGRIIEMPKGIRPTSDKVREALFDILKCRMQGAIFLDLYCGSGAVGIEAFSRGANNVVFVDNDPNSIAVLRKNLNQLGISELSNVSVYKKDVIGWCHVRAWHHKTMVPRSCVAPDIVFLDPPYCQDIAKNTLIAISGCDILAPNTVIVAEVFKKDILPEEIGPLRKMRVYKYGDTKLELFVCKR